MPFPLAAVIGGAASLAGQAVGAYSAGRMNKRAERFSRQMYERQRADSLSDWNMQNAYNDPSAQMARLKAAGLNPNLVYGNGADAQSSSQPRASNMSTPRYGIPRFDAGSVVAQAMATKQLQANIARTEAETEAIRSRTVDQDFKNALNSMIGLDKMSDRYDWASDQVAIQSQRANAEFEAYKAGTGGKFGKGSPAAAAQAANFNRAVEDLKALTASRKLRETAIRIKEFEADLADQGISPSSPWFIKILGDLLQEVGLKSMGTLFK